MEAAATTVAIAGREMVRGMSGMSFGSAPSRRGGQNVVPAIDVIGCGAATRQYHLPMLRRLVRTKQIRVRGCYDVNLQAAANAKRLVHAAEALTEAPEDISPVRGALVATPPAYHHQFASRYLAAGKVVFVEKPMTANLSEASDLVELAETSAGLLLVGQFRRFYPSLEAAAQILRMETLGPLKRIVAAEGSRWDWPASSRYFIESSSGGVVGDTGSHLVDMVLYVTGGDVQNEPLDKVISVQKDVELEPSHDVIAEVELRGLSGHVGLDLRLSRTRPIASGIHFICSRGSIYVPTRFSPFALLGTERGTVRVSPITGSLVAQDALGCFALEYREFLDALNGRSTSAILSATRFVRLARLLEMLTTPQGVQ